VCYSLLPVARGHWSHQCSPRSQQKLSLMARGTKHAWNLTSIDVLQSGDPLLQLRDVLLCTLASLRPELAGQLAAMGTRVTGEYQQELFKRAQLLLYCSRFHPPPSTVCLLLKLS
jgi:hypothetical protein